MKKLYLLFLNSHSFLLIQFIELVIITGVFPSSIKSKEILIRKSRGYISFLRGENQYTFPYRIYPSLFNERTIKNYEYPTVQVNGLAIDNPIKYLDFYLF